MTRENKLALVIGFGLILFVGVLVSDYFSTASRQEVADLRNGSAPLLATTLVKPQIVDLDPIGYERRPAPPHRAATGEAASANAGAEAAPASVLQEGVVESVPPPDFPDPNYVPPGFQRVHAQPEEPVERIRMGELPERLQQDPAMAFHDVTRGQTLYSICLAHYDDPSLVQALAEFNNMSDVRSLKVGRRLRIPAVAVLRGEAASPAPSSAAAVRTSESPKTQGEAVVMYTVKPNDTLSRIALQVLGSRGRVQELIDLNHDLLDDPNQLTVGTKIRVPSKSQARAR
jgi:nucleoid-associated protein YgaU